MYSLLRPLLFRLDTESGHDIVVNMLAWISRSPVLLRMLRSGTGDRLPRREMELFGCHCRNPVGLAAGLDKGARAYPALSAMGFGWVELGTVTPRPQPGNPRPRLFRLPEDNALINRMGFNSAGLDPFVSNLRRLPRPDCAIGINLGKNASTAIDSATGDYIAGMKAVYELADYITINVSSPNTETLRELQNMQHLNRLLAGLAACRRSMRDSTRRHVPLALKIAPDLTDDEIDVIGEQMTTHGIDAVVATNTTLQRPAGLRSPLSQEPGGLSGSPLRGLATRVVARLRQRLGDGIAIVGVGGVGGAADAAEKLQAGACAIQLYTSFIYQGPTVVRNILAGLAPTVTGHAQSTASDGNNLT